jgi:hypothetical protein
MQNSKEHNLWYLQLFFISECYNCLILLKCHICPNCIDAAMPADCMINVLISFLFVDALVSVVSGHMTPTQGDALFSDLRLVSLEKQLNIELKVMYIELIFHLKFLLLKAPLFKCTLHILCNLVSNKLQCVIKSNATHLPSKGIASVHGYWTTNSHSPSGFCCTSKQNEIKI